MCRVNPQTCALITLLFHFAVTSHAQLGVALNATNLTWTSPVPSWSTQSTTTHDGVSAAQSSTLNSSSQSSTIQTTVTGPGTLTFWWFTPSYDNQLSFIIGTTNRSSIIGSPNWQEQTFYFGPGSHTLKWTYSQLSPFIGSGLRGYLDQVTYTAGVVAPTLLSQPQSQSQITGLSASFSANLAGTPPFSYQWRFNDTDIPGATNSSFTVTNVQAGNLGFYSVFVTNAAGSVVSSNVLLDFGEVTAWGMNLSVPATAGIGATNVLAVACGYLHSLALKADGTLMQWGANIPTNAPADLTNLIAIAAGSGYSLTLRSDGSVLAWGNFAHNPTNVPADLTNAVAIAAGSDHALALKADGTVAVWANTISSNTNKPASLTNVVAIAAGLVHSLALRRDGTVVAWGTGSGGSTNIPPDLTNVVGIAGGFSHSLALNFGGTLRAWGQMSVPSGLSNAVAIASGYFHCLALKSDGAVVAWGNNTYGQTNVPTGLTNVVAIAAAASHNLALVGDGPPIQSALTVNPVYSNDGFSLTVPSQSGRVFALEYKDSIPDSDWIALPLVAGTGRMLTLTDPNATNHTQRYYRVWRW